RVPARAMAQCPTFAIDCSLGAGAALFLVANRKDPHAPVARPRGPDRDSRLRAGTGAHSLARGEWRRPHRHEHTPAAGLHRDRRAAGDDDRRCEEDAAIDLAGGTENRREPAAGRVVARTVLHRMASRDQMAIDILHHDHRRIDDQPEIERADRKQVRGFPLQGQDQHSEAQGERDRRRDDQRRSQISQEQPLEEEDEEDALDHVVDDGAGGQCDQARPVVD
ncbi:hypothetical protein QU38_02740, partial [Staphylococcus aureus]